MTGDEQEPVTIHESRFTIPVIDTHTHLCDPAFADDLDEAIARAQTVGVRGVIAVGETLEDAEANLALADRHPGFVHPAGGLFPTILDEDKATELEQWMRDRGDCWIAVGEVGLDHWKVQDESEREVQERIFQSFVELAIDLDIPVNVHSRAAARPTVERLIDWGARKVQLHAFDGRAVKAEPAVEAGFYFSVPPSIVRSRQKQKLVARVPLDNLLLETDSPVLGADPALRNEPAEIVTSLNGIAGIKGLPVGEVRESLFNNTVRLYGEGILGS